jgi:toxin secretion/phage lysis holin
MWYSIAVVAFIITDYITGVVNAAMKSKISSRTMHEGLGHKFAYCVLIFVAYIIDTIQLNSSLNLPFELFPIVSIGIIAIELTSIIENVCEINPKLKEAKFMGIFEKNNNNNDRKEDENNE